MILPERTRFCHPPLPPKTWRPSGWGRHVLGYPGRAQCSHGAVLTYLERPNIQCVYSAWSAGCKVQGAGWWSRRRHSKKNPAYMRRCSLKAYILRIIDEPSCLDRIRFVVTGPESVHDRRVAREPGTKKPEIERLRTSRLERWPAGRSPEPCEELCHSFTCMPVLLLWKYSMYCL